VTDVGPEYVTPLGDGETRDCCRNDALDSSGPTTPVVFWAAYCALVGGTTVLLLALDLVEMRPHR
jgi:hypothetical protein